MPPSHTTTRAHRAAAIVAGAGIASLLLWGTAEPAAAAAVTTTNADGLVFTADDSDVTAGATVTSYAGSYGAEVDIPASVTISGTSYDVTAIAPSAFLSSVSAVTFPDTLKTIGDYAFMAFGPGLSAVSIPDSVTSIGTGAFYANYNLTTVRIGTGVTQIPRDAFGGDPIDSLTITGAVTSIGANAFSAIQVDTFTVPASVTVMGNGVLADYFGEAGPSRVVFLGPAPTAIDEYSLGTAEVQPTVTYYWRYGATLVEGGFTGPTWFGYPTQAVAIVDFVTAQDSGAPVSQEVAVGGTANRPDEPTRENFSFAGWYTAATGGTKYDFSTVVDTDVTLYAHWAAAAAVPSVPVSPTAQSVAVQPVLAATGLSTEVPLTAAVLLFLWGIAMTVASKHRRSLR